MPFYDKRHEIYISAGCLFWGLRIVVPLKLRGTLLHSLHESHQGIVRMKSIARSYIWWPNIDSAIENLAKSCKSCAESQAAPAKLPIHSWSFPERPWQRLHIDFLGPLNGLYWLVIVDAYSKWPEAIPFNSMPSTKEMLAKFRDIIARFGLPEEISSDNGPQFASTEFQNFCKINGIRSKLSAPYHPATNGEAERFVRTFKQAYKSFKSTNWKREAVSFLMSYRTTPHAATNRTPSEMLFGRNIRTKWDLLRPSIILKNAKHRGKEVPAFEIGDLVWCMNYRQAKLNGYLVEFVKF